MMIARIAKSVMERRGRISTLGKDIKTPRNHTTRPSALEGWQGEQFWAQTCRAPARSNLHSCHLRSSFFFALGSLAPAASPVHSVHEKASGYPLASRVRTVGAIWAGLGAEGGHHDGRSAGERNAAARSYAGRDHPERAHCSEDAARACGVRIHQCEEAGRERRWRRGLEVVGGGRAGGKS